MRIRKLVLTALCASIALAAAAPAFADDDDWHRQGRPEWREHQWRAHEWREHEEREHEWRRPYYAPPFVGVPGYYGPPPGIYVNPGYYR